MASIDSKIERTPASQTAATTNSSVNRSQPNSLASAKASMKRGNY